MLQKIKQELKAGRHLLQFGFLAAVGQALAMIAPLVIAKFFSETLFGSYCLAKMVVFFFTTLLISSAQKPFVVYANRERAATGRINKSFSAQCVFLAFSVLLFLVISLAFSGQISAFAGVSSADVLFMCLGFIGMALKSFSYNLFMALGERIKAAFVEFVFGLLTLGMVVMLALTDNINLRMVFLTYLVSAAAVILVFARTVELGQLLPFDFDWEHFKNMLNFTKWVMFGATAVFFINWVDNIILRAYRAPLADIGEYNLGFQIFKGLLTLIFIISNYFLPFVSSNIDNKDKIREYLYSKRPRIFFLGLAMLAVIFVASPYFFELFYGQAYQKSAFILRLLLFAAVTVLYGVFYSPILNALKRFKFTQTAFIAHLLVKTLVNLWLVPRMGMQGAAIGTVVAYGCHLLIIEIYFRVKLKKALIG